MRSLMLVGVAGALLVARPAQADEAGRQRSSISGGVGQRAEVTVLGPDTAAGWGADLVLAANDPTAPPAGTRFGVIDEHGFLGWCQVLAESWQPGPRCASCAGWERAAIWEVAPKRTSRGVVVAIRSGAGSRAPWTRTSPPSSEKEAAAIEGEVNLAAGHARLPRLRYDTARQLIDRASAEARADWVWWAVDQNAEPPSREDALLSVDPRCSSVFYDGTPLGGLHATAGFGAGVSMIPTGVKSNLVFSGTGPVPQRGDLYEIIDSRGVQAILRITGEVVDVTCYDNCPSWWRGAEWQARPRRPVVGSSLTVGPLVGLLPHARLVGSHDVARWRRNGTPDIERTVLIDLDGDGRAELRSSSYVCGCEHQASETAVRNGGVWRVTEREVLWILPMWSYCRPPRAAARPAPARRR
jgi:hypothetical protein